MHACMSAVTVQGGVQGQHDLPIAGTRVVGRPELSHQFWLGYWVRTCVTGAGVSREPRQAKTPFNAGLLPADPVRDHGVRTAHGGRVRPPRTRDLPLPATRRRRLGADTMETTHSTHMHAAVFNGRAADKD